MKKLLLTLTISFILVNGFGQDTDLQLLDEYEQYKQECYNDSTKEELMIIYIWNGYKFERKLIRYLECFPMESNIIKDTIIYHHKQPTFEGFMEWLNNKYK